MFKSLFCIFVLFLSTAWASQTTRILIKVPSITPKDATLYLTGNTDQLCHWNPTCLPLAKINESLYSTTIEKSSNQIEFKITRGEYSNQAALQNGRALNNFVINNEDIFAYTIENWADLGPFGNSNIVKHNIYSRELDKIIKLQIYLPDNYSRKKSYPVIYAHDGQNLFDRESATFGKEWGMDEFLNSTQREYIVVGIESDHERTKTFHYYQNGRNYARFIVSTLIPFIDENFSTQKSKRYLMGSSLGASVSISIALEYPNTFTKVLAISFPAFAYDDYLFQVLKESSPLKSFPLYIDHGDIGQDAQYPKHAVRFLQQLTLNQFNKNLITYKHFHFFDHTESDWACRLESLLKFMEE